MRCDVCGKFRRVADVVQFDAGDQITSERVTECRWCMSRADLKFYKMTTETTNGESDE